MNSATTTPSKYDVIIVGLGCVGLSTAFYCSKMGMKVLGFERNSKSGALGSSSVGCGRIWRHMHTEERYYNMQLEGLEVWKEIEKKTGVEINSKGGLLYMKKPESQEFKELAKYGEVLTAQQIHERWPAMRVPSYLSGVFCKEAGVTRVKVALQETKNVAMKQGSDLRYNQNVIHIDHQSSTVTLESGEKFIAKNIVVCCGALTDQFYSTKTQFKAPKQQINCYFLEDREGLPDCFLMEDYSGTNGIMVFGTLDGDDLTKYKLGNELNEDPHLMLRVIKDLFPSKIDKITHVIPCFYSMSEDDEFIFEKVGSTVYGFGLCGRGFKHMGYHGKRIYHLLKGNYSEANKYLKEKKEQIAKL